MVLGVALAEAAEVAAAGVEASKVPVVEEEVAAVAAVGTSCHWLWEVREVG